MIESIGRAVNALGYELVEAKQLSGQMLQVFIDFPWVQGEPVRYITVEDCERVSNQLTYILPVEGIDYSRLEVSSPGLDRPLYTLLDYQRFNGEHIALTLKHSTDPESMQRNFHGILEVDDTNLAILVTNEAQQTQKITFTLELVEKARLFPIFPEKKKLSPKKHKKKM